MKNGERGILIFAPTSAKFIASAGPRWDGRSPAAHARAAYVFDASQTEGKPLLTSPRSTAEVIRRYFRHVVVGERILKVPAYAKEDHLAREMSAF